MTKKEYQSQVCTVYDLDSYMACFAPLGYVLHSVVSLGTPPDRDGYQPSPEVLVVMERDVAEGS